MHPNRKTSLLLPAPALPATFAPVYPSNIAKTSPGGTLWSAGETVPGANLQFWHGFPSGAPAEPDVRARLRAGYTAGIRAAR